LIWGLALAGRPAHAEEVFSQSSTASSEPGPAAPADTLEASSDATGAFVTRVPFKVPVFHGIEPALAVTYSSNGGNGIAGVGWGLSGSSSIQRSTPGRGAPSYDASDAFYLDGEQLFPCSEIGPKTAPGCTYNDASSSLVYYVSKVDHGARIAFDPAQQVWTVWLQSGVVREYRQGLFTGSGQINRWLLTKVTDVSGNEVRYAYAYSLPVPDQGTWVVEAPQLATIQYGPFEVRFRYEPTPRADQETRALGDSTMQIVRNRLATVDVLGPGSSGPKRIRAYALGYGTSSWTDRSLLTTVQEYGADATVADDGFVDIHASPTKLPPTRITYPSDPVQAPQPVKASLAPADVGTPATGAPLAPIDLTLPAPAMPDGQLRDALSHVRHVSLDFNGDGRTDHVIVYSLPNQVLVQPYVTQADGNYQALGQTTLNLTTLNDGAPEVHVGDVNGDGVQDLLIAGVEQDSTEEDRHFYTLTSLTFDADAQTMVASPAHEDRELRAFLHDDNRRSQLLVGDVDGDGLVDVVDILTYPREVQFFAPNSGLPTTNYVFVRTLLGRGDGSFDRTELIQRYDLAPASDFPVDNRVVGPRDWLLVDYDGDGRADLVSISRWARPVGHNSVDPWLLVLAQLYIKDYTPNWSSIYWMPEIWGHGICVSRAKAVDHEEMLAEPFDDESCRTVDDTAFKRGELTPQQALDAWFGRRVSWQLGDVDGDGLIDLVRVLEDDVPGSTKSYVAALLARDGYNTLRTGEDPRGSELDTGLPHRSTALAVADVNRDGRHDLMMLRASGPDACLHSHFATMNVARMVSTSTTNDRIEFQPLSEPGSPASGLTRWRACDPAMSTSPLGPSGPLVDLLHLADVEKEEVQSVDVADHDGDGYPDVVSWGWNTNLASPMVDANGATCTTAPCAARRISLVPTVQLGLPKGDDTRAWRPADINGDGLMDYVRLVDKHPGLGVEARLRARDGSFSSASATLATQLPGLVVGDFRVGDVDGDGRSDLVKARFEPGAEGSTIRFLTVHATATGGFELLQSTVPAPRRMEDARRWHLLDIDGDGRTDWVYLSTTPMLPTTECVAPQWLETYAYLSVGDGSFTAVYGGGQVACGMPPRGNSFKVADVNGDGAADLVGVFQQPSAVIEGARERNVIALLSRHDGTFLLRASSGLISGPELGGASWQIADFNGDGLADMGVVGHRDVTGSSGPSYHLATLQVSELVSRGDGTFAARPSDAFDFGTTIYPRDFYHKNVSRYRLTDFDGDGRTDLVELKSDQPDGGSDVTILIKPYVSRPDGGGWLRFQEQPVETAALVGLAPGSFATRANNAVAYDVDGDSVPDLEWLDGSGGAISAARVKRSAPRDALSTIENPLGGRRSPHYAPRNSQAFLNDPARGCKLPRGAGFVVDAITTEGTYGGPAYATSYRYQCPVYSARERRLLGYQLATIAQPGVENHPASWTVNRYAIDERCGARVQSSQTYDPFSSGNEGPLVTTHELAAEAEGAPYRCQTTATASTVSGSAGTYTVRTSFEYDSFGNVTKKSDEGDVAVTGDEVTTRTLFDIEPTRYLVRPYREDVYAGDEQPSALLASTRLCFDGDASCASTRALDRGLVTARLVKSDRDSRWIKTSIGYDVWGNPTSVVDPNGNVSTTEYDFATHRFPGLVTDALGHTVLTEYDPGFGVPVRKIDLANQALVASYQYDPLGRLISIDEPGGGVHRDIWYEDDLLSSVTVATADGTGTGVWTTSFRDGLGRTFLTTRKHGDGTTALQRVQYSDDSARPAATSRWHADGDSPLWEAFQYDHLGRTTKVIHPDGTESTTTYDARSTTTTDEAGHARTSIVDARGRLVQVVEDHEGAPATTTYEYDLLGRKKRAVDPAGKVTLYGWDSLGRLREQNDPDLGQLSFSYDDAGNRVASTDGNGVVTRISYDALNRPTRKTHDGSTRVIEWHYDEPGVAYGAGRLTSILDSASGCDATARFQYDSHGRVIRTEKCFDGITVAMGQQYDAYGRLAAIVYPDEETVSRGYDLAGRLQSVNGYVTSMAYDLEGRLMYAQLGNATTESYAYDWFRGWLTSAMVTIPGTGNVVTSFYQYHPDALVRQSMVWHGQGEGVYRTYSYDAQHRLREVVSQGASAGVESFSYDAAGNMLFNSRLGHYAYDGPQGVAGEHPKAHGAYRAGPLTFHHDAAGNVVQEDLEGEHATSLSREFFWNDDNMLTRVDVHKNDGSGSVDVTTMEYAADGSRIKSVSPSGQKTYTFFPEVTLECPASCDPLSDPPCCNVKKRYFAGPRVVAERDVAAGTLSYQHQDRLGSTLALTDGSGAILPQSDYRYSAFGVLEQGNAAMASDFTYTGARQDAKTSAEAGAGLVYLAARYYDPRAGRFLSPDTVTPGVGALALNRYAYAFQNPISNVDPSGHVPDDAGGYQLPEPYASYNQGQHADNTIVNYESAPMVPMEQVVVNSIVSAATTLLSPLYDAMCPTCAASNAPMWDSLRPLPYPNSTGYGAERALESVFAGLIQSVGFSALGAITNPGLASLAHSDDPALLRLIGNLNKPFETALADEAANSGRYLYRGVHAGHPALGDAMNGTVVPGNVNGTISAELHNEGGWSHISPYTSWTRDLSTAQGFANEYGPGGVILRFETGAPPPGAAWRWEFSGDGFFESEVLLRGIRTGANVIIP
jgi:RHS repeat-associated protein